MLEVRVDRQSGLHIMTPFPNGCDDPLGYLRSSIAPRNSRVSQ